MHAFLSPARPWLAVAVATSLAAFASHATEGGGSTYKVGVENYLSAASPPPGLYALAYVNHYQADELRDDGGRVVPVPGFKVKADVLPPRLIWVSDLKVADANLVVHGVLPMVRISVAAAGREDTVSAQGDVTLGSALAWHFSPTLHAIAGIDLVLPTGSYDASRLANPGRNYRSLQPTAGLSLVQPSGFNVDLKLTYGVNSRNSDTQVRSGDELILDYAAGWALGPAWTLGVGGYMYRQLTADQAAGAKLSGTEGRGHSIGPSVKFQADNGWFITAKWEREAGQRNRPQGQQVWLKAALPF